MERIEKHITKQSESETRWTIVEQVIARDGRPAVRATIWKQYRQNRPVALSSTLYVFSSPTPLLIVGRPAVGQWADKIWKAPARWWELPNEKEQPNLDQTTYQDYIAWSNATEQVYANS